jgi:hypothetical protein
MTVPMKWLADDLEGGMAEQQVTRIEIPYPTEPEPQLRIGVGACRLNLRPGKGPSWVSGTYQDPSGSLPLTITQQGGTVRIGQGHRWTEILSWRRGAPELDLAIDPGAGRGFAMAVETGASECECELGGLPLTRLAVRQGAGKMTLSFSAPNPAEMRQLEIGGGASGMTVSGLANDNAAEMSLEGGAASYVLDFGGNLRRDGSVRITTGMSSVDLRVPATTAARIRSESVLGSVDVGDGFTTRDGSYWTQAAQSGASPTLSISVSVTMGSLRLRSI